MKRYLAHNYTTMLMALFLAVLTWIYLFTQGNGPAEIDVQFLPRLDADDVASVTYRIDDEKIELVPGRSIRVQVMGPKVDVRQLALRPNIIACEFRVDPKRLQAPQGSLSFDLIREYFNLPATINVDPLPRIRIEYARYEQSEIELVADRTRVEGSLRPGYEVESVTPNPRRIRARVPADRKGVDRAEIRRVPIEGRVESFTLSNWFLGPDASDLKIQPLEPFTVEVRIAERPTLRRITADLHVQAKPDHLPRIQLETPRTVTLELRGPVDLVEEAAQRPAVFAPYVLVTDKDVETPGTRNVGELGCTILDRKFQERLSVTVMADLKPENRQAKIRVLPPK